MDQAATSSTEKGPRIQSTLETTVLATPSLDMLRMRPASKMLRCMTKCGKCDLFPALRLPPGRDTESVPRVRHSFQTDAIVPTQHPWGICYNLSRDHLLTPAPYFLEPRTQLPFNGPALPGFSDASTFSLASHAAFLCRNPPEPSYSRALFHLLLLERYVG